MNIIIIDCLSTGDGRRKFSRDFIGGGPKLIAGIINQLGLDNLNIQIIRAEDLLFINLENDRLLKIKDLCLISAMTMDINCVKTIVNRWRSINHDKLIIVGGPIASDHNLLKKIDADILIQGEGEKIISSLIKIIINKTFHPKELCNVKGIIFRRGEKIIKTSPLSVLKSKDYNYYSDPQFSLKYIKCYSNYQSARIYVECLRGCSNYNRTKFKLQNAKQCMEECNTCHHQDLKKRVRCPSNIPPGCGFCSTIYSFGYPKSRNMDCIISEISGLIDLGARRIVLGGPDFLDYQREVLTENSILTNPDIPPEPNYDALNELIGAITGLKPVREKKVQIFIENVKANLCTLEALQILAKIPNSIFSIGCETGSIQFSNYLGRPYIPEKTLEAIKIAFKLGIRVHVYFIHSLPGETIEYLKESIYLIQELYKYGVEKITIYKYQEFPGAPFYLLKNKSKMMQLHDKELNKYRKKLISLVINFNKKRKEEMIGKRYTVFMAEQYYLNRSHVIGHIIQGGPKVLVKNASNELGKELIVKIRGIISDKLIEGDVISE